MQVQGRIVVPPIQNAEPGEQGMPMVQLETKTDDEKA
jgi:hypothetical protein